MNQSDCTTLIESFFDFNDGLNFQTPTRLQSSQVVLALKKLKETCFGSVSFEEIFQEELPEFLRNEHFVDAIVSISSRLCFKEGDLREFGSGVSSLLVGASAHAVCEALERLLPKLGGMKSARQSAESAYSLRFRKWIEFDFNPLDRGDAKNIFQAPSGQAVHPLAREALRNAFCELVERNFVASVRGTEDWSDITESICDRAEVFKQTANHWVQRGFGFRVCAAKSRFGPFVVVASAINRELPGFPASFRGTASDFCLDYAPLQAVSELNRSGHFGPYQSLSGYDQALAERGKLSPNDYYYGFLSRLMLTDWLAAETQRATNISLTELVGREHASPKFTLHRLLDEVEDLYVVPICVPSELPLYGFKVCVSGLPLNAVERVAL
jgi:hypothetical protein